MTSGFFGVVKRGGKPGMLDVGCWLLVVGCWLFGAGSLHLPRSEFRVPDSVPLPGWVRGGHSAFQFSGSRLKVRCSMFDVRCSMFDVRCWMLDVGCWMFDVGCWMLDVGCSMFDVG